MFLNFSVDNVSRILILCKHFACDRTMLFLEKPEQFIPKFDIVSAFVEYDGKILLLLRALHKPQGGTWCVPAGKVETGEALEVAMLRELQEETGIIPVSGRLSYFKETFVRYREYEYPYHMYHLKLLEDAPIVIDTKDHIDYVWATPEEALQMNLIEDEDACIKLFYNI